MFFSPRALLKPLLVTVSIAVVLSVAGVLLAWYTARTASAVGDSSAFVLRQHILWSAGTVLATAATVVILLLLSAGASSLPAPWRWSLGFSVFVLSPLVGLLLTASFYSLFTLPPADGLSAAFITPGKLTASLPTTLGIVALIAFGKPRAVRNGPA
jgi:hypothetical protein